jgi:hypothetical protein
MSDQPETSTWQHTTLTRDKTSIPRRDSNPRSHKASGRRPTSCVGHGARTKRKEIRTRCRGEIWKNETTRKAQELSDKNIKIGIKNRMGCDSSIRLLQDKGK